MAAVPNERSAARLVMFVLWVMFGVATAASAILYVMGAVTGNTGHAITALVSMVPDAMLLGGAIFMTERVVLLEGRHAGSVVVLQRD